MSTASLLYHRTVLVIIRIAQLTLPKIYLFGKVEEGVFRLNNIFSGGPWTFQLPTI